MRKQPIIKAPHWREYLTRSKVSRAEKKQSLLYIGMDIKRIYIRLPQSVCLEFTDNWSSLDVVLADKAYPLERKAVVRLETSDDLAAFKNAKLLDIRSFMMPGEERPFHAVDRAKRLSILTDRGEIVFKSVISQHPDSVTPKKHRFDFSTHTFPPPQIGYYEAECCLLDLYKIETPEHLERVTERIKDNDECGRLMIFPTLAEAIEVLRGDLDEEEELEEFKRLGWVDPLPEKVQ